MGWDRRTWLRLGCGRCSDLPRSARSRLATTTVGLPDSAVRESRDRVRAAIRNAGFEFPQERITVNLAPAELRKEGAAFEPVGLHETGGGEDADRRGQVEGPPSPL